MQRPPIPGPQPPSPADQKTEKDEKAARKEETDLWREECMRLRQADILEKSLTASNKSFTPSSYLRVDDPTKSPMKYYEDIIKKFRGESAAFAGEPSAHLGSISTSRSLQEKLKGPQTFIKFPFAGMSPEELLALQNLDKGNKAAQDKLADILAKAPHYFIDEQGVISKIPPPEARLRFKHPELWLGEYLVKKVADKDLPFHMDERTGKMQSAVEAAIFVLAMGSILPLVPFLMPFLHLFVGNSYKEIINGHREVMQLKKELEGATTFGIRWEGKPHKDVIWGMLLMAEKEGMSFDKSPAKTDPAVLAFIEGRPYTHPGPPVEVWPPLSKKQSEKFLAQIRKLEDNKTKAQMFTDTKDKPLLAKDTAALTAQRKLEDEFKDAPTNFPGAVDPHADALKAKYDDMRDPDGKAAQLATDATALDKQAQALAETSTELGQSARSYQYLSEHPESFLDAPPLGSEYKSWHENLGDRFKEMQEKTKDPVGALDELEKRFDGSSKDMQKLVEARASAVDDISRRTAEIKEQSTRIKDVMEDRLKPENVGSLTPPQKIQTETQLKKAVDTLATVDKTEKTLVEQKKVNEELQSFLKTWPDQVKERKEKALEARSGKTLKT